MNTVSILLINTEGPIERMIVYHPTVKFPEEPGGYTAPTSILLPGESPIDGAVRTLQSNLKLIVARQNVLLWTIKNTEDAKHYLFYTNVPLNTYTAELGEYEWCILMECNNLHNWPETLSVPDKYLQLYTDFGVRRSAG